jgi:hypothetical protein
VVVVNAADPSATSSLFRIGTHKRGVKDLCFSPDGRTLVSVGADGVIRTWDVSGLDASPPTKPSPRGVVSNVAKVDTGDPDASLGESGALVPTRMCWLRDGQHLAVPVGTDVRLLRRGPDGGLSDPRSAGIGLGCKDQITSVRVSPSGRYLAAVEMGYRVSIWDMGDRPSTLCRPAGKKANSVTASGENAPSLAAVVQSDSELAAFAWSSESASVAIVDEDGRVSRVEPIAEDDPAPHDAAGEDQTAREEAVAEEGVAEPTSSSGLAKVFHDAPQSDDEDETSSKRDGAPQKLQRRHEMLDDEAAEGGSDEEEQGPAELGDDVVEIKRRLGFRDDEELTLEEGQRLLRMQRDPLAAAARVLQEQSQRDQAVAAAKQDAEDLGMDATDDFAHQAVIVQRPFQPGSSEPNKRDARRRFLCWNGLGSITSREDTMHSTIEIEMDDAKLDSGRGRGTTVRISDTFGYSMGALSSEGAVLAAPRVTPEDMMEAPEDVLVDVPAKKRSLMKKTASMVSWQPVRGWTENSRQRMDIELPLDEDARAVAAGREWFAVATSRRMLRIFRTSGVQETPFVLPGPVVSMVGRGPLLFVLTIAGPPTPHGQPLAWQLWICGDSRLTAAGTAAGVSEAALGSAAMTGLGGIPGRGGVAPSGFSASGIGMGSVPRLVSGGELPQRPVETVDWIGITEEGMVLSKDTGGLVSALAPGAGWTWAAVADLSADGVADSRKGQIAWVVDAVDGRIVYALLRSGTRGPPVLPRPVLSTHLLRPPLVGFRPSKSSESGELAAPAWAPEADCLMTRLRADTHRWAVSSGVPVELASVPISALRDDDTLDAPGGDISVVGAASLGLASTRHTSKAILTSERAIDKEVLRLIHSALSKGGSSSSGARNGGAADLRAFHLASRLVLPKSFDVAVELAQKSGRAALAERLYSLRRARAIERQSLTAATDPPPAKKADDSSSTKPGADKVAAMLETLRGAVEDARRAAAEAREATAQSARADHLGPTPRPQKRSRGAVEAVEGMASLDQLPAHQVDLSDATGVDETPGTVEPTAKRVARFSDDVPASPHSPPRSRGANPFAKTSKRSPSRPQRDAFASLVAPSPEKAKTLRTQAQVPPPLGRSSTVSREARAAREREIANLG